MNMLEFMNKAKEIYNKEEIKSREYLYLSQRLNDDEIIAVKIFVGSLERANELEPSKEEDIRIL